MTKYPTRGEFEAMRQKVLNLEQISTQQAELIKNFGIIIHGDSQLGVEGLHIRQKKDDRFRQEVKENFREMHESINEKGEEIMDNVNETLKPIIVNITNLMDWRKAWNKTIDIMTGAKTWKIVIFIVILLISLGVFIKLKILNLLGEWSK